MPAVPARLRPLPSALAALAAFATLVACGGGGGSSAAPAGTGGGSGPEVTRLAVGIVPVVDHAAVFVAQAEGFFTEEGLTVTTQAVQGGAAAVPALVSGDLQAAFATYPSFFLAKSQGIDVTIVAEGIRATEETGGVYVRADSAIRKAADLAGKTIAVNTLNNTGDVTIKAVLREQGVDPAGVEFIELPFPDMKGALEQGRVDAAWLVEPFRSGVAAAGGRKVLVSYGGVAAGIPVSGLGMSKKFATENPRTAAAFARAIEKANALIAEQPDRARKAVTTYSKTTPEQAAGLELGRWIAGKPNVQELERWNDLLVQTGVLKDKVAVADLVLNT